jgi:hypothetical protein
MSELMNLRMNIFLLITDPRMADIFTQPDNLKLILQGLSSTNEEVVLNTIATLYFLVTPRTYSRM